jgi:hypothetical protein
VNLVARQGATRSPPSSLLGISVDTRDARAWAQKSANAARVPLHLTEPQTQRGRSPTLIRGVPDQHFTETIQGVSNVTHDQIL